MTDRRCSAFMDRRPGAGCRAVGGGYERDPPRLARGFARMNIAKAEPISISRLKSALRARRGSESGAGWRSGS
ncbi:hypothetical protein EVAR_27795_1 [Eumeta japonica]|uniref:Uncharacterized protein n=1 Tax=Eumeta variegata TaxID=151549 RepID=A0A4C1VJ43_EUMVA|nr:hypothetical protein EVAR_27795_1 [Eumeta japonica]